MKPRSRHTILPENKSPGGGTRSLAVDPEDVTANSGDEKEWKVRHDDKLKRIKRVIFWGLLVMAILRLASSFFVEKAVDRKEGPDSTNTKLILAPTEQKPGIDTSRESVVKPSLPLDEKVEIKPELKLEKEEAEDEEEEDEEEAAGEAEEEEDDEDDENEGDDDKDNGEEEQEEREQEEDKEGNKEEEDEEEEGDKEDVEVTDGQ